MFLGSSHTSLGAVLGAAAALWMPTNAALRLSFEPCYSSRVAMQFKQKTDYVDVKGSKLAMKLKLFGSYPNKEGKLQNYELKNVPGGFLVMLAVPCQDYWVLAVEC